MKGCAKRTNLLLPEVTLAEQLGLLQCCVRRLDEFLLVIDDGEILLGQVLDLAILDFPKFLSDLRDKSEVVGDDDNTTLKVLDGKGESVNGGHIQMVSRLIEKQDVWVFHGKLCKYDTRTGGVRNLYSV